MFKKLFKKNSHKAHRSGISHEKHEDFVQNDEISLVQSGLRRKFLEVQMDHLRNVIAGQLDALKDEVNVEAILADLGEGYILRKDLESVRLDTNFDSEPTLVLRFAHETNSARETVDRLVPLGRYV